MLIGWERGTGAVRLVKGLNLSEVDTNDILGDNAARLLGYDGAACRTFQTRTSPSALQVGGQT